MQIATHNHDQPSPARFASDFGAWSALETKRSFRSLAPGCPGVAKK
jgi:hypothetical protein